MLGKVIEDIHLKIFLTLIDCMVMYIWISTASNVKYSPDQISPCGIRNTQECKKSITWFGSQRREKITGLLLPLPEIRERTNFTPDSSKSLL